MRHTTAFIKGQYIIGYYWSTNAKLVVGVSCKTVFVIATNCVIVSGSPTLKSKGTKKVDKGGSSNTVTPKPTHF